MATFADDPVADKSRWKPGCAAGDDWAKDEQTKIHRGETSASVVTVADLTDGYIASKEGAIGASHLGAIEHTAAWLASLGITSLADHRLCDRVRDSLANMTSARPNQTTVAPVSVCVKNRHILILRSMGNWGVDDGKLPINPFRRLKRIKSQPEDPRRTYTLAELRHIVSDEARDHALVERRKLVELLAKTTAASRLPLTNSACMWAPCTIQD
jgi:hypothetical protein